MKIRFLFLFVAALALASCGGNSGNTHSHNGETHSHDEAASSAGDTHQGGEAYTSAYVCPMHCEGSGSSEPGNCPACGMDYVARAEHIQDGHGHE